VNRLEGAEESFQPFKRKLETGIQGLHEYEDLPFSSIVVEGKISRSVHVARSLNYGGTLNLVAAVITIQKTPGRTDGLLL
jgi:hypothetical protein